MSTFLGNLKEYPGLFVDYFRDKALGPDIGAYFLSHCHSDHMHGLKNPAFEKRLKSGGRQNPKIYLTKISQLFLENDPKYKHLKPYMVALQVNEPVTVNLSSEDPEKNNEVIVTLLQAGHCPGSVMFLFEGKNGRVLYTGDFRLTMADLKSSSFLLDELGECVLDLRNSFRKKKIDNLYIDTTFCKPDAFYIPDRNDSLTAALDIIKPWLKDKRNYVRIICSAQYGYERFFIGLNESLGVKVHVNDSKFYRYNGIPEIQDVLTILPHESRIHACIWQKTDQKSESDNEDIEGVYGSYKLPCGFKSDHQMRVLHIKLSAMWFAQNVGITEISSKTNACDFYRVCYSMHSSLQELRDFVSYTEPIAITPNVVPKGSDTVTLVKWLRNPLPKANRSELGSQSPHLLGHLKLPILSKSVDRGDVTSPENTGFNSSQESKEYYESELDLSGCEDIGPVYIKTPPVHNPGSPQWCFEMTPEKDTLRIPSSLSEISDCPIESPFNLSLISALSSTAKNRGNDWVENPNLSRTTIFDNGNMQPTENFELSQKSDLSSIGDNGNLKETQNMELSQVSDSISGAENGGGLEDTQNLELLSQISELRSTAENAIQKMEVDQVSELSSNLNNGSSDASRNGELSEISTADKGHLNTKVNLEELHCPTKNNGNLGASDDVILSEVATADNCNLDRTVNAEEPGQRTTDNDCLDVSCNVEICENSTTLNDETGAIANSLDIAQDMPDLEEITRISIDESEKEIVGEISLIDAVNCKDISMGKSQQPEIEKEEDEEEDFARGLTSSDSSRTSDGSSSDKSVVKDDEINLGLSEYPSDSASWSEDPQAPASFSNEKRSHVEGSELALSSKRVKYMDTDPFMSNYSRVDREQKRVNQGSNGVSPCSPDLFSDDSDDSVVECGDSNEDYCTDSDDKPRLAPVHTRPFEVVDITSSESRLNGSSSEEEDEDSNPVTTFSGKTCRRMDSDETPEKIVTQDGDVLYPVNRVQKQLFPQNETDVEVITLD